MTTSIDSPDSTYESKVRRSFANQAFMHTLGATIARLAPGKCDIVMPSHPSLAQQHGYIHAGAVGAIADSAAGYAALTLAPPDSSVLTVEYKINLVAPAQGDSFVARARVIKSGKTLKIALSEVFSLRDGTETLCAVMTATIMILHGKPEPA